MNTFQREQLLKNKFIGIAVKLSSLEKAKIQLKELLKFRITIVIDAEFDRLDNYIKNTKLERANIICTVQVKRKDAREQMQYFANIGMKVVLVSGHQNYLQQLGKIDNVADEFSYFIENYARIIAYIGIGKKMRLRIEKKLSKKLNISTILELLGNHNQHGSVIWTYFAEKELSEEGKAFLTRRKSFIDKNQKYILQDIESLKKLAIAHYFILYIDILMKKKYLSTVESLITVEHQKKFEINQD